MYLFKFAVLLLTMAFQTSEVSQIQKDPIEVKIHLKNNGFAPRKFTIVSYAPNQKGNDAIGFYLLPGASRVLAFKEGSRIYIVNPRQQEKVMSGISINADPPFLTVEHKHEGQTFLLK